MTPEEERSLTPEQRAYFQRVYNISTSISQTFKDMLEIAVKTDDISIIKPFIEHILVQCNQQATANPIQVKKTGLIDIEGKEI